MFSSSATTATEIKACLGKLSKWRIKRPLASFIVTSGCREAAGTCPRHGSSLMLSRGFVLKSFVLLACKTCTPFRLPAPRVHRQWIPECSEKNSLPITSLKEALVPYYTFKGAV